MRSFLHIMLLIFSAILFQNCSDDNIVDSLQNNEMKSIDKTLSYPYYFENRAITIFADPEISKIYENVASIYVPLNYSSNWATFVRFNLTIENPQSVQVTVNGQVVSYFEYGNDWILNYSFIPGANYTIVARVKYSQHHNNNTCGTWTSWTDFTTDL